MPLTHGREYTEEEMWENLEYWIRAITPIAEEEGIRLGIHPCDPPVPVLGGVPQLLRSFDSYKRLIEMYPSDSQRQSSSAKAPSHRWKGRTSTR